MLFAYPASAGDSNNPAPPPAANAAEIETITTRYDDLLRKIALLEQNRKLLDDEARELHTLIDSLHAVPPAAVPVKPSPAVPFGVAADPSIIAPKKEEVAPLSVRIGAAQFTPGGFLDFITAYRSTNVGSGIGTGFGSIPFANTTAGQLSESRFGAQNSRASLRVDSDVAGYHLTGYAEVDFLGSQPTNAYVTSNSDTLRLRLYWADLRRGKWEVLGGQGWSLLTPNRVGISPFTGDVFYSQNVDTNYQVGFPWSRDPQFRVVHHTTDHVTLAAALENPEQFVGAGVALPAAIPSSELDTGSNLATPAPFPDILIKAAYDRKIAGHAFHAETAGLFRQFRDVRPSDNHQFSQSGRGAAVNFNVEVVKNLHAIVNTFYSSGGGRYIFGLGPDLIIRPDGSISPVRSGSALAGLEYQITPGWLVYAYGGMAYFAKDVSVDSNGALVGFGAPGSTAASANRLLREPTIGVTRILWKKAEYGALQMGVQYSYVERYPWLVAAGAPAGAYSNMFMTDFRYVLP